MRLNSPQINLITKACMKASRSLIRDFGEIENLQVSTKGPGDFVTSADKRTEKILIDELQKAHPDYGIVTEESGIINNDNMILLISPGGAVPYLMYLKMCSADSVRYGCAGILY